MDDQNVVVRWQDSYSVGVALIDGQHKELIRMTNELALGCRKGGIAAEAYFMKTIQGAVNYIKTHFYTEEVIMNRLGYPELEAHKKEHEDFVHQVLRNVREFEEKKNLVPLELVKYLQNWVLVHIARSDKKYGDFIDSLRDKGILKEADLQVDLRSIKK
jgi:hemerythrin-like metal-binding protein